MKRVVVDASVIAAIAFREREGERLARDLEGSTIYAPSLLAFELTNTAWKKARRQPDRCADVVAALEKALSESSGISWKPVEPADVALLALTLGCSAYDAAYVWLAGSTGADLVTLDQRLVDLTAKAFT